MAEKRQLPHLRGRNYAQPQESNNEPAGGNLYASNPVGNQPVGYNPGLQQNPVDNQTNSQAFQSQNNNYNPYGGYQQQVDPNQNRGPAPVQQLANNNLPPQNLATNMNPAANNPPQNYMSTSAPQNYMNSSTPQNYMNSSTDGNSANKKKSNKIDPDQIPRPVLTTEESLKPKRYTTSQRPGVPYQSQCLYTTVDDGNAGPRLMRASVYNLPNESSNLQQTHIPFGVVVQPLADSTIDEEPVPLMEYPEGPFRCGRCKAYVNPYFNFVDMGKSAICNLCKMSNQVSNEYFCSLNEFGKRRDKQNRPELTKGAYEFIAPKDYNNKPINKNYIMICLEMTLPSITNGIFNQVISSAQSILEYIPAPERTEICIMTFDNAMTFYKLPQDLGNDLQTIVVGDLEDPCVPLPKQSLFLNVKDSRDKIDYLFEKLQKTAENMVKNSSNNKNQFQSTPIGSVINNAASYFAPEVGRIIAFSTQMPTIGYGKIKRRDDYKLINTDKEKTLFVPQVDSFDKLGKYCLENRVGVDLFVFGSEYYDITTIAPVCSLTGGSLYYYPQYKYYEDGEKLHYDIARNLTRNYAYDVIMTIRTSQGLSLQEYHTGYGRVAVRDLEFSILDADKSLGIFLKQDEKITDAEAYVQYAVLYTNSFGQRVIRVLNMNFTINNSIANIYRSADIDCTLSLILRKYSTAINQQPIKTIREQLMQLLVNILHSYRVNCASSSTSGQLILPEGLKLLPLYIQSAFKNELFKLGSAPDERAYAMYSFGVNGCYYTVSILYPKLYPLHPIWEQSNSETGPGMYFEDRVVMPNSIALTKDKLQNFGIYIIDSYETLYIYVMKTVLPDVLTQLFGVQNFFEITDAGRLPNFVESDQAARVNAIIDQLRKNKNSAYQNVKIITEKEPLLDQFFLNLLIEDDVKGNESYADFLCSIHKLIQQKYT